MRRSYEKTREEVIQHLRKLQRALQEYEKEPDDTYIFADTLSDIERSIVDLRHALRVAEYEHNRGHYSKAIDILERALDNAFNHPDLDIFA